MRATVGTTLLVGMAIVAMTGACDTKPKSSSAAKPDDTAVAAEPQATAAALAPATLLPTPSGPVSMECARFNGGSPCTQTEQRFVNKSVDCYNCLVNASCLDDAQFGDKSHECEDLSGEAPGGSRKGSSNEALCLSTVDCILKTKCAASDVALCYCGSLGPGTACATGSASGDGPCAEAEAAGAYHTANEPAGAISPTLASIRLPAGKADSIFACAKLNNCDALCSR